MKIDFRKVALKLKNIGISVVPLRTDGSKLPSIKWKEFQERIMTEDEIDTHFKECGGVAAVTGKVSRLYCLDFDLKYQFEGQDFWKMFMDQVPNNVKGKMLINETKNAGMHIWLRTDFEATSTSLTRRHNTIPELMTKFYEVMDRGDKDELTVSEIIMKAPYETVIETRSKGSYAVIAHPEYKRFYGETIREFTVEEVESLNQVAYSLDYCYNPKPVFTGDIKDFGSLRKYNDDGCGSKSLEMLESSGLFQYVETERDGNIKVLRQGSNSKFSGRIYANSGVLHLFTNNSVFDTSSKTSFSPFDIFMVTNNLTFEQAVNELTNI